MSDLIERLNWAADHIDGGLHPSSTCVPLLSEAADRIEQLEAFDDAVLDRLQDAEGRLRADLDEAVALLHKIADDDADEFFGALDAAPEITAFLARIEKKP